MAANTAPASRAPPPTSPGRSHVTEAVNKLRELSPLWEMLNVGIDLNSIEWAEH